MSCGSIYKIQFPNGKHYIGLTTTSLKQRTNEHKQCAKNGDTKIVYNAIRKYEMIDTFELIEIDTATTLEKLCELEIGYILTYNSYYVGGYGYNMTFGGAGARGYIFTEDVRQKMSEITKEYYEEHPEAREKMSEIKKKYFEDNPNKGKEHGEKIKEYYEEHPEAREKMSEIRKNYFEEHPKARQKVGEKTKEYFINNPEARQKMSEKTKEYFINNPEARRKISEKIKEYYENNPDARRQKTDTLGQNMPFDVFTVGGTLIQTFTYQFEAREYLQKEHNINSYIKISAVLRGIRKSSVGFVFKYK